MEFINGSSNFADGLGTIWGGLYDIIDPLVKAAGGLEKLLKLLP